MTLQSSGPISIEDINIELGRLAGATFSMNGTEERELAGVPSGSYSFSDFYGKSSAYAKFTTGSFVSSIGYISTVPTGSIDVTSLSIDGNTYTIEQIVYDTNVPHQFTLLLRGGTDPGKDILPRSLESITVDGVTMSTEDLHSYSSDATSVTYTWRDTSTTLPTLVDGVTYGFDFVDSPYNWLHAGEDGIYSGYRQQPPSFDYGEMSPRVLASLGSREVLNVSTHFNAITGYQLQVIIDGVVSSNHFTSITLEGAFANGGTSLTLNTASAQSFDNPSSTSRWIWQGLSGSSTMISGNSYKITFV